MRRLLVDVCFGLQRVKVRACARSRGKVEKEMKEEFLLNRRELLFKGGKGLAAALGLAAVAGLGIKPRTANAQSTFVATPAMTEGPYFVDEKLNRFDIRVDPTTGAVAAGLPLYLGITVS